LASHVVTAEEGDERVLSSAFGGFESRPALEKCGKDRGIFVAEPIENLREVPFQGASEAVGDGDTIVDECSPELHHSPEAAHVCALWPQARQLVRVPKKQLQCVLGIGGVILGVASHAA
jgi:hypothetical protein